MEREITPVALDDVAEGTLSIPAAMGGAGALGVVGRRRPSRRSCKVVMVVGGGREGVGGGCVLLYGMSRKLRSSNCCGGEVIRETRVRSIQ